MAFDSASVEVCGIPGIVAPALARHYNRVMPFRVVALALCVVLSVSPFAMASADGDMPTPLELAAIWDRTRLPMPPPLLVRHADVVAAIGAMKASAPDLFQSEPIGASVEGRSITHLWAGQGPLHVLLWSQMHGDEPTATVALFDVLNYIQANRRAPHVARLLDRLTLHVVPMLNPDGAEAPQRRNAQGIDINRDALLLQTPEGRTLKALRDRLNPPIGFNLHNQNWRTSVGDTGRPAAMSLLSVAFDEARSDNPGRVLTRKVAGIIRDAVEPLAPGMLARYDDEFEVRAFGDNLTKWGTSVVLIETGPYPGPDPDRALIRMNFVALLTALDALATGKADNADAGRYETLPLNGSSLLHTLIKGARIVAGTGVAPFVGDIGIGASRVVRQQDGLRRVGFSARIDDLGDLRVFGALETIDAAGLVAAPLWSALEVGQQVSLPEGRTAGPYIAPGQPAAIALLKPSGDGRYVVERIVKVE